MASSPQALHASLLRPAVIHILRAAGFHSARPTVVDTLTDICARYLLLLASRTADSVYDRSSNTTDADPREHLDRPPPLDSDVPTITDVRLALASAAFFTSTTTASEETWREALRKPIAAYPPGAAQEKERQRRDADDTRDITDFLDWITGPTNREIRRIAGTLPDEDPASFTAASGSVEPSAAPDKPAPKDDYLAILKKKHSKTGDEARYAGTVLGRHADERPRMKIDGGPPTLQDWRAGLKRKQVDVGAESASSRRKG